MGNPSTVGSTVGAIGIGSNILGGIFGASGAEAEGQAQQGMYNYQAGVAQINSQIAQQNADYAIQSGEQQAQQYGIQAAQQFGAIKSAQASSGIDVNSGSALQTQQSQKLVSNLDQDQIRSNAAKTAYDYNTQAVQFQNQAQLYTMAGTNAAAAGNINAVSSILGTVSSVSSKWLQGSTLGMSGSSNSSSAIFGSNASDTGGIY